MKSLNRSIESFPIDRSCLVGDMLLWRTGLRSGRPQNVAILMHIAGECRWLLPIFRCLFAHSLMPVHWRCFQIRSHYNRVARCRRKQQAKDNCKNIWRHRIRLWFPRAYCIYLRVHWTVKKKITCTWHNLVYSQFSFHPPCLSLARYLTRLCKFSCSLKLQKKKIWSFMSFTFFCQPVANSSLQIFKTGSRQSGHLSLGWPVAWDSILEGKSPKLASCESDLPTFTSESFGFEGVSIAQTLSCQTRSQFFHPEWNPCPSIKARCSRFSWVPKRSSPVYSSIKMHLGMEDRLEVVWGKLGNVVHGL